MVDDKAEQQKEGSQFFLLLVSATVSEGSQMCTPPLNQSRVPHLFPFADMVCDGHSRGMVPVVLVDKTNSVSLGEVD